MKEKLKTIAIYLPQFHRMKENDEWWGDGYTEWTAVKQAESYYANHNQPRIPLNEFYYDLLCPATMKWQAELAKEYGIYGFCFYHYYFSNGKLVMQEPAEKLLTWKDIPMQFCFSWASIPWVRSWSKYANGAMGGSIASKFEKKYDGSQEILMEQDYGDEKQWQYHFNYLLPFFMDERYIKIGGRPVFIFHHADHILCLERMVKFWRDLAKKNGLSGLYLIGTTNKFNDDYDFLDALNAQEPQCLLSDFIRFSDVTKRNISSRYLDYEEACLWSINRHYPSNKKIFLGVFAGYDTTPRHGKKGVIIDNVRADVFERAYKSICAKSMERNNEIVFINAWNEWAEGNYLEPDTISGYDMLEAVKKVNIEMDECKIIDPYVDVCFSNNLEKMYRMVLSESKEYNKKMNDVV